MPHKFRRVVRKGGVRNKKSQKEMLDGIRDQIDIVSPRFADMAAQTDNAELQDVPTQTDSAVTMVLNVNASTQTDIIDSS